MNAHSPVIVGTPVLSPTSGTGFISQIIAGKAGHFMIGAGGLTPVAHDYEICFHGRTTVLADSIVAPWIDSAKRAEIASKTPEEVAELRAAAVAADAEFRAKARASQEEAQRRREAFLIEAESKVPAGAKSVIVAELVSDRSESQTDYWGSVTTRTVILGFSTHTRDLFPELRKAALNLPETADLFDAPEAAEHREKYSMGAGYYLKQGGRDSDGWKIHKRTLYNGPRDVPMGEWSLTPPAAPKVSQAAPVACGAGFAISEHAHTKGGFQMWVVAIGERVERDEFERLHDLAKESGGWYSRKWGASPSGFAFKIQGAAEAFALANIGESVTQGEPAARPAAAKVSPGGAGVAEKLRTMADALQSQIDDKFRDRLANTPKRQREAGSARLDGYRLQRTQQAMRALAAHHEAGTVPGELRGMTTKAAIFDLARAEIVNSGGYYDAGRETGNPGARSPAALALWAMLTGPSDEERAAVALREKVESLQFANIPGYFPTPAAVVAQMIEAADLPRGCVILEPEAGSGGILDPVRESDPSAQFVVFERHNTLREILTAKGYQLAGADFMESEPFKVARVLMNPPFENGQDMAHVMRAFSHLEPGGRLVAIMSPGPFFRSDAKATAFRAWFDSHGGEKVDLPAGAFKESGTGVGTVLVTIDA